MVKDIEPFAGAACGRFMARMMCDPKRAGVATVPACLVGILSLGVPSRRGVIEEIEWG